MVKCRVFGCCLLLLIGLPLRADQPITIDVDATEAPRKLFHARLTIPVEPGPLTLYYPKWIPGEHAPSGPIADVAGLKIHAGDTVLPWRRDDVDMFAIHCTVPEGVKSIEVSLEYLGNARVGTPNMAVIRWNEMLLYPKGKPQQALEYQASLRVPAGWKVGTALPVTSADGPMTRFGTVSLETLVDSPVLLGAHFRQVKLGPSGEPEHFLELACENEAGLDLQPDVKAQFDRLVAEAGALYGARHYKNYHFLLTLSDQMPYHGLEHHESSDNGAPERTLVDADVRRATAFLLPHEYTHSWNGKYRRPAGLVAPDFHKVYRTDLLWVYEGLTEYLGTILTARCGLWTPEETRDYIAYTAEKMHNQKGRSWRPLEDTAVAAPFLYGTAPAWGARRRGVDFYDEGVLLWLEVDTLIRQKSNGSRSIDDFCKRFHGGESGRPAVKPYMLDDVVADLNAVVPHDWKGLLTRRLRTVSDEAPLEGIVQSGWRLGYGDKPTSVQKSTEAVMKGADLASSIGLVIGAEGAVVDVIPGKAADKAGIGPGMKIVAVNARRFSPEILTRAIAGTKKGDARLELLMETGDLFHTHVLEYHDGEKYPRLVRIEGQPDLLSQIFKPQTAEPAKNP